MHWSFLSDCDSFLLVIPHGQGGGGREGRGRSIFLRYCAVIFYGQSLSGERSVLFITLLFHVQQANDFHLRGIPRFAFTFKKLLANVASNQQS